MNYSKKIKIYSRYSHQHHAIKRIYLHILKEHPLNSWLSRCKKTYLKMRSNFSLLFLPPNMDYIFLNRKWKFLYRMMCMPERSKKSESKFNQFLWPTRDIMKSCGCQFNKKGDEELKKFAFPSKLSYWQKIFLMGKFSAEEAAVFKVDCRLLSEWTRAVEQLLLKYSSKWTHSNKISTFWDWGRVGDMTRWLRLDNLT